MIRPPANLLVAWVGCVLLLVGGCGDRQSPVKDEVRLLRRLTCLESSPGDVTALTVNTWQVAAEWTCSIAMPWAEYLATIDGTSGYQRRDTTATRAVYRRSTATDYYVVTIDVRPERPGKLLMKFTAGPY